jgi:hypothetical protein
MLNSISASAELNWILFALALSARINQIVASSSHPFFSDSLKEFAALWWQATARSYSWSALFMEAAE